MGTRLSETEIQKSLDFCVNLFNPVSPDHHERLAALGEQMGNDILDADAPPVRPAALEKVLQDVVAPGSRPDHEPDAESTNETRLLFNRLNARKVVHSEFVTNNLESEALDGFVVRLERGRLGLAKPSLP